MNEYLNIANAAIDTLVKKLKCANKWKLLATTKYPNETVYQYKLMCHDASLDSYAWFDVFVSMVNDKLMGYKIYDKLGNELKTLNDELVEGYFDKRDTREYFADFRYMSVQPSKPRGFDYGT